jgi:hypothetical protein
MSLETLIAEVAEKMASTQPVYLAEEIVEIVLRHVQKAHAEKAPSLRKFKKGDRVIWQTISGAHRLNYEGIVSATARRQCYVLFEGGGHWFDNSELSLAPEKPLRK